MPSSFVGRSVNVMTMSATSAVFSSSGASATSRPSLVIDLTVQPAGGTTTLTRYLPGGKPYVLNAPDSSGWPGGADRNGVNDDDDDEASARSIAIGIATIAFASGRSRAPSNS